MSKTISNIIMRRGVPAEVVSRETVPAFEELRARIAAHEDVAARKKHESWARMQQIRERAREAEGAEMTALRLELEPINREIEAMKSVIIEHHAAEVQPIFAQKGEPALMVF